MPVRLNVPMAEYLVLDALSSGVAFEAITRSPLHGRHKQLNSDRWGKKADLGTVVHQMLLEGCDDCVAWMPEEFTDFRKKEVQELRDAAYADGKTPMLQSQKGDCERMLESVRYQLSLIPEMQPLLIGSGDPEVTVEWEDFGIACKARPDYIANELHISLKTTAGSAEPTSFNRRTLTPSGYDFSLMFYDRGLKANGWDGQHRILVIEQDPPYAIQVFEIGTVKKDINAAKAERAIRLWSECLERGEFPGYVGTAVVDATPWELAEAEEREILAMQAGSGR